MGTASIVSYFGKLSTLKNRQKCHNVMKRNSLIAFSTQKGINSPSLGLSECSLGLSECSLGLSECCLGLSECKRVNSLPPSVVC